jgi:RNA polymerase sigma-70 factor, ECF subfamily
MSLDTSQEQVLLHAAQGGDGEAFRALVEGRRVELHAHCYRMLASSDDADDAVQEALLRAWRALPRFEGRSSVRTWLFRITTNTALDIVSGRARRELPIQFGPPIGSGEPPGDPATEVPWIGPYAAPDPKASHGLPEARYAVRESIELAFVAALQHLPAHQRAVFILREALGFSAADTATVLDSTVAAVNSALQRARTRVDARLPKVSQQEELRLLGDGAARELASRYARAIEESDIDALLALLTADVTWSMPPLASWYRGHEHVAAFLRGSVFPERWRHVTTHANGQLAVAGYLFDAHRSSFVAGALDVLDLRGGRVAAVTGFLTTAALTFEERELHGAARGLFERFGLPEELTSS